MYFLGVLRRTALWGSVLLLIASITIGFTDIVSVLLFGGIYLIFAFFHIIICKLKKSSRTSSQIYFSALGYDIRAPFSKLGIFFALLTRKWIIHDDSKYHNFVDWCQIVCGGIWSIIILGIAAFLIISIII